MGDHYQDREEGLAAWAGWFPRFLQACGSPRQPVGPAQSLRGSPAGPHVSTEGHAAPFLMLCAPPLAAGRYFPRGSPIVAPGPCPWPPHLPSPDLAH